MTNNEAIETLKVAKSEIEWGYPMDYQIALDKAIEALEQEPYKDFCEFVAKRVDTFGTNISLMCKDILDYLEKEPCGKDINVHATDAISRQMAIDALGECPMNWTDSDGEITAERDWKDTVKMLKSLPSVIPQPKTEVLDKIRAEIEQITDTMGVSYNQYVSKIDVLQIIDKYKSESEG